MTILYPPNALLSISAQKLFRARSEFGFGMFGQLKYGDEFDIIAWQPFGTAFFGDVEFGDFLLLTGIYAQRMVKERNPAVPGKRTYRKATIRMITYVPKNTRQTNQQIWRNKFADAIPAWRALTDEERAVYHTKAVGKHKSGYNIFISKYMSS